MRTWNAGSRSSSNRSLVYACGGAAAGAHASSAQHRDPETEAFFRQYGLDGVCRGR